MGRDHETEAMARTYSDFEACNMLWLHMRKSKAAFNESSRNSELELARRFLKVLEYKIDELANI